MNDTNFCVFTGRLTKRAEFFQSAKGNAYAKFAIAVNEVVSGKKITMFINCICFRDVEKYLTNGVKGSPMIIKGRIQKSKNTITNIEYLSVIVDEMNFTDNSASKNTVETDYQRDRSLDNENGEDYSGFDTGTSIDISSDDLPF